MSARSGLAGKKTSRPHLGPSGPNFCVGRKNPKNAFFLPIFLGGPLLLSTLGGAIGKIYQRLQRGEPLSNNTVAFSRVYDHWSKSIYKRLQSDEHLWKLPIAPPRVDSSKGPKPGE